MNVYRFSLIIFSGLFLMFGSVYADIATTKHNLSVSGPGGVKAVSETQICIFCHTPHNSRPNSPLWNRNDPGLNYTPYTSSTAIASPGQPTGGSLLCLSCHDGTIALGEVLSRQQPITMAGGVTTMPIGPGRLGTDLSDDHPISFVFDNSLASKQGELVNPATLTGAVKLDKSGQLQCSTCHDAHDDSFGNFMVMDNTASAVCQTCHTPVRWAQSPHNLSNAIWDGTGPDPWPFTTQTSVMANACQNCHQPHSAGNAERLLNYPAEEDNCTTCHNSHVANEDIQAEFNRASIHPIFDSNTIHRPDEPTVAGSRHVECVDCHNSHQAGFNQGTLSPVLSGVRGINLSGSEVDPANFEYEICFRCHADSFNKPNEITPRQLTQTNVRLEFQLSNPSFHPVTSVGVNPNVPSLIFPLTTSSTISCGDCHNSSNSGSSGGNGPEGAHGSDFSPILGKKYLTTDFTAESADAYALCYGCHSRNSILGDQSFSEHNKHIVKEDTPCNVCHDPHGISSTQGNSTNNSKLINFDISVVQPAMGMNNVLRFESTGTFRGSCYLNCHGKNHNPKSYGGG